MRKYFSFFKLRFQTGLQYRSATLSGVVVQLPWGLMEILAYRALHDTNAEAFPMEFSAVVTYIWLKEAFLVLFNTWAADNDIFSLIMDGGIAYELCRPVSVYRMWFARNIGGRLASAALRCVPILVVAAFLPQPYRLSAPASILHFCLFLVAMVMGLGVTVAFCMLVYILAFFTLSPQGVRMVLMGAVELLSGSVIPLPFIPYPIRSILELLPFASMQNVPFRIYTGDLAGAEMAQALLLQAFWLVMLLWAGKFLYRLAERRIVVQGG